MKKLLGIALSVASIGLVAPAVEAKAAAPSTSASVAASAAAPQWGQWGRRRNNRRVYVTTQSRFVRVGRRVYRETYQVRHLPNGRTTTRLISRVRVR